MRSVSSIAGLAALLGTILASQNALAQGRGSGIDSAWQSYRRVPQTRTSPYGNTSGWGWRNPGGVGRFKEYYPPGNQFQNPGSPVEQAHFDEGPVSTRRSMQLQSQQVGIAKYNAIQGHIDRYGMPRMGFYGYGAGFGLGYGAAFPR